MKSKQTKSYDEKLKSNAADSYNQYLAKSDIKNKNSYLDSAANAAVSRELSSSKRGSVSDSLSSSGLSKSGYADYLSAQNYKTYSDKMDAAEREKATSEYKNNSGYEKYLTNYEKLQNEISQGFIDSFGKGNNFSIEDAYKEAVSAGLNENYAMYAATKGVDAALNNTIERAISFAKLNSLSAYKAKKYALSLGLSEFYAEKVYKAMSVYNEGEKEYFASMSADQYYDYILSQSSN